MWEGAECAISVLAANTSIIADTGPGTVFADAFKEIRRDMIEIALKTVALHPFLEVNRVRPIDILKTLISNGSQLNVSERAPLLAEAGILHDEARVRIAVLN